MSTHGDIQKITSILVCLVILFGGVFSAQARSASPDAASWKNISPKGGTISQVVLAPTNPSIVYIALGNRVLRSTDGGNHWSGPGSGLPENEITALVVNPSNPLVALAGIEPAPGVYWTADGGAHWQLSNQGITAASGRVSLIGNPKDGSVLYAYSGNSLYKTTDGGKNWHPATQGLVDGEIRKLAISPSNPSVLYLVINDTSVYKTTDGAGSWSLVNNELTELYMVGLAVDPRTPDTLYLGNARGKVYRSTDGGIHWSERSRGLPGTNIANLLVDPAFPDTVFAVVLGDGLYVSQDAGMSWNRTAGMGSQAPLALAMHPSRPHMLYAGFSEYGIYRSPDSGSTWISLNRGLDDVRIRKLFINPHLPPVLYAGTAIGLFMTTSRGARWTDSPPWTDLPAIIALAVDPEDARILYAGSDGGGLFKTTDGGRHWSTIGAGLFPLIEVDVVAVDPLTPSTVYAGGWDYGLYKSEDAGKTWNITGLKEVSVTGLVIDPTNPQVLYAAYQDGVSKSMDGGVTWTAKNNGLDGACANSLLIDPVQPSTVYALMCDAGLFKTTDGGETWNPIVNGLPRDVSYYNIPAFIMDPQDPSILYAGIWDEGVYRSLDGGASWTPFGTGLPADPEILALAASPGGVPCVFVGLYNAGIYSTCRPIPVTTSLSRLSIETGDAGFNLTVTGDGFTEDATVRWAGEDLPATFDNDGGLNTTIPAEKLSRPGDVDVSVFVPEPGGGVSDPFIFTVQARGQALPERIFLPLVSY